MIGEVEANFIPGSRRPVAVVVIARDWQTGRAIVLVYGCGLLLSIRLSQRIVAVIDRLSHASQQVGKGDFSVRVAVPEQDQLGLLASSFNDMTRDLENL